MSAYLDGIDRAHVHYIWRLKTAAKRSGNRSASMLTILNGLLADVLTDARWEELSARFCAPKEPPDGAAPPPAERGVPVRTPGR